MSDETKVSVASITLFEPYDDPAFIRAGRHLGADLFVMAYEEDTDKMVVVPKATREIHVIPWANIKGFKLEREAPPEKKPPEVSGGPARPAGGGTRRARTAP